jgi:hypothetical protein
MKPLFRWTVGKLKDIGMDMLRCSVASFRRLYPEFDFIVCFNLLTDDQKCQLAGLEIEPFNQNSLIDYFPNYPPACGSWKFYPPRLRPDAHEIFLDNDIILLDRLDEIDQFLASSNKTIVSESRNRRLYGKYDGRVPDGVLVNSGLFGVPPHYPLEDRLRWFMGKDATPGWSGFFDEQGLVAALLTQQDHVTVPLKHLQIITPDMNVRFDCQGLHFCGANSAGSHRAWGQFKHGMLS